MSQHACNLSIDNLSTSSYYLITHFKNNELKQLKVLIIRRLITEHDTHYACRFRHEECLIVTLDYQCYSIPYNQLVLVRDKFWST